MAGDTDFIKENGIPPTQLPEAYSVYANAYVLLDSERDFTREIPWSAYVRYGLFYEFSRDQIDWLIEIGRRVDRVILAERVKQSGNAAPTR